MKQDSDIEFDFLNAIEAITDAIEEGNSRETSLCLLNGALAAEPTENIRRCFGLSIKEAVFFAIIFYNVNPSLTLFFRMFRTYFL